MKKTVWQLLSNTSTCKFYHFFTHKVRIIHISRNPPTLGDFLLFSIGKFVTIRYFFAIIQHFYRFSKNNYIKSKDIPMEKPYLCLVKSFHHAEYVFCIRWFWQPKININDTLTKQRQSKKRCENAGTHLARHTQAIEPIGIHSAKHRTAS